VEQLSWTDDMMLRAERPETPMQIQMLLIYDQSTATAGKVTVAEVEHLVQPGDINPDHIMTPGIYVQRIVHMPNATKHIEQRTVRKRS